MDQLPLIDISALREPKTQAYRAAITELGTAFHEVGFAGVVGHTIKPSVIATVRQQVEALFSLPMQQKAEHVITQHNYRGYIPLGYFTPNGSKQAADQYEGYKLHLETQLADPIRQACDLYGPNAWPSALPSLQAAIHDYWQQCDQLSMSILTALFCHLELPLNFLSAAFRQPLTNMTLLHYPPSNANEDHFGIHPHKDTDALTILAPDQVGGLYLRPRNSHNWIEATVPLETLIVNVGDMLETWSSGYFVSTPHKVVNASGKPRYSFPYFAVPRFDVLIEPLTGSDDFATDRSSESTADTAGEISREIWQSNWPNASPIDTHLDPYTY